ncbi:MAG TPA: hypothetical protein PKD84_01495 [Propionicimonas sp.]|nr:hypothetical protein [Propionicimonas sp.]
MPGTRGARAAGPRSAQSLGQLAVAQRAPGGQLHHQSKPLRHLLDDDVKLLERGWLDAVLVAGDTGSADAHRVNVDQLVFNRGVHDRP